MTSKLPLFDPIKVSSGEVLPNRIAKAAMEENMADVDQLPDAALRTLYERWSRGGVASTLLSMEVMREGQLVLHLPLRLQSSPYASTRIRPDGPSEIAPTIAAHGVP